MTKSLEKLKVFWASEGIITSVKATDNELNSYESKHKIIVPEDLKEYFRFLNGTNEEYDNNSFQFYSLLQLKSIDEDLKNWNGHPDYSGIVDTLYEYRKYFVFSDYLFHMFSYAIQLKDDNEINEVIVISGNKYKKVATSFSEFVELYLSNSLELFLG